LIDFATTIVQSDSVDGIDETNFCCKFAGFLPQYVSPDATKGGRATEVGLVNQKGETIIFDPEGECLTLRG